MMFDSSVATAQGEIMDVRRLYSFTSWYSPSEITRTACWAIAA
ncbi:hypothetical protein [Rubrolithibacter danxiaensis]